MIVKKKKKLYTWISRNKGTDSGTFLIKPPMVAAQESGNGMNL